MRTRCWRMPFDLFARSMFMLLCLGWVMGTALAQDDDEAFVDDDVELAADEAIDVEAEAEAEVEVEAEAEAEAAAEPEPTQEDIIAEREARPLPTAFPNVPTIEDSVPHFVAVRLDPWAKNILYVMFDGNRDVGYNRMYAWVPEGRQYAQPTPFQIGGDNRFPAIRWTETEGDEAVEVAYTFVSSRRTGMHGGGGGSRMNYLTGEITVTAPSERRAYTNISFSYSVDYMRDKSPRGGENLLQVRIPVSLNPPTNFVGLRPGGAWNGISFKWKIDHQTVADIDHAQVKIGGSPQVGNRGIQVLSMPRGFFDIEVQVAPYMKDPVFRETVHMPELARDGVLVSVPFGWYRASWSGTTHPWIGGRDLSGRTSGLMALSRARPAVPGAGGGGGAASALRGPPPSQLR